MPAVGQKPLELRLEVSQANFQRQGALVLWLALKDHSKGLKGARLGKLRGGGKRYAMQNTLDPVPAF